MFQYLLVVIVFLGCKKYPEGPKISFRSPTSRIVGEWNCVEYKVDGEDYLTPIFYGFGSSTGLPCEGFIPGTTVYRKSCTEYKELNSYIKFTFEENGNMKEVWQRDRFGLNSQQSIEKCDCIYDRVVYNESNVYDEKWLFSGDKENLIVEFDGKREEFQILSLSNKALILYHPEENGKKETKIALEKL